MNKFKLDMQTLLEVATMLSNAKDPAAFSIRSIIREHRGENAPCCFGEDDCSSMMMVRCPWSFDCGSSIEWVKPVDNYDELTVPQDVTRSAWAMDKTKSIEGKVFVFRWLPNLKCWSSESIQVAV